MARFISTQSINLELPLRVDHLPNRGTEVRASIMEGTVVAGGFFVVSTVARQGVSACVTSPLGTGPNSIQARHSLGREGISVLSREIVGDIGLRIAAIDSEGVRSIITSPGVEVEPDPRDLAGINLRENDYIFASLNDLAYPQLAEILTQWIERLPDNLFLAVAGGPLVGEVDLDVMVKVLGRADLLTLNKHQADTVRMRLGRGPIVEVLRRYVKPETVLVLRDGANGAAIQEFAGQVPRGVPAYPTDLVDTTGAGEAHTGVLLASLMMGTPLDQACERANAAASLAMGRRGYYRIPTASQIDNFLAENSRL
ncbi:PfkB family carbohydrate kinase [uncultured Mobiluncus sp.]|uniref:PfkB family carbohydrate kinase n=1 Tax=uncultured Mobiluncus sp. TaxID=293425 RepID=UPI0028040063|nr:PfkB family carbohydrate kinase [uncultured Mobiluncus sp.]